jgi:hypothetical protein
VDGVVPTGSLVERLSREYAEAGRRIRALPGVQPHA